jgi:ribosomal protein L11 methyltransferase
LIVFLVLMVSLKFSVPYDLLEAVDGLAEELGCDNLSVFEDPACGFSERSDENDFPIVNRFDVEILFRSKADANEFQLVMSERLDGVGGDGKTDDVSEDDWVDFYVSGLRPVSCGNFYIFNGSLPKGSENSDLIPIKINSSLAFGSGHHQTTQACLLNITRLMEMAREIPDAPSILDMGCGTGILGICAAKICEDAELLGVDVDEEATKITHDNYLANGISGTVLTAATVPPNRRFDLILCNILKQPLIDMHRDFFDSLKDGGYLIISGFILSQEDEILEHYRGVGFICSNSVYLDEWVSILLRKPL